MLTRLKVDGFKNLDGVDVQFGPFTCVAGPNGVGKSNLFDAIAFLAALADKPLAEAAAQIRGTEGRVGDVRALFRTAGGQRAAEMSFVAEMIVPEVGTDDLGSEARASMTFLRYELRLRHREDLGALGPLEVAYERMEHINKTGAHEVLGFPHTPAWRDSVIHGRRTVPYIETQQDGGRAVVLIRTDSQGGLGGGGPRKLLAANMPRTVLSTANNAAEHRTLVLARKEMMGWTLFQLEPTALRRPDRTGTRPGVARDGAHLPATLWALLQEAERAEAGGEANTRARLANRVAGLVRDVRDLRVDVDEQRDLVTLVLTDLAGTQHPAAVLSDGTLRVVALALLQASAGGPALLCVEEPENSVHPAQIPQLVALLEDCAVATDEAVGHGNPLRQVILNTHSPAVVACVAEAALLVATGSGGFRPALGRPAVGFLPLPGTWRTGPGRGARAAGPAELLAFLHPLVVAADSAADGALATGAARVLSRSGALGLPPFVAAQGAS